MSGIPLTRCQFLVPFADILNNLGAPLDTLLAKHRLPTSLVEKADHYIPILQAIRFAEAGQRSQDIVDFGFHAAKQVLFDHLSSQIRTVISQSPTLLVALQQTCKWASIEDTNLSMWLEYSDEEVRICTKLTGTEGLQHLEHSQWLQLMFTILIVRQFAGLHWNPATIAFEARYVPSTETQSFWPNSRFLSGQHASWIDVPISHLSLLGRPNTSPTPPLAEENGPSSYEIVGLLRMMLPSYLDQGPPTLAEIAEMAGLSARSLQRKLAQAGLSYSDLVNTARFDNAARLLRDTDSKIIDIALSSGYADHAHFTRAFRRFAGVTPRHFREQARLGL